MFRGSGLWLIACVVGAAATVSVRADFLVDMDLFIAGGEGPDTAPLYRIPSIVQAADGSLMTFVQGRFSSGDPGRTSGGIGLHAKRSIDNGMTWSPLMVILPNQDDQGTYWDYNAWGPVVIEGTGEATDPLGFFFTEWPDTARTTQSFFMTSDDGGQTWSTPIDVTSQIEDPSWFRTDAGPGRAIQLQWQTDPARNGRLVFTGKRATTDNASTTDPVSFYSDDLGATFNRGTEADDGPVATNENEVVELTNGDLLMDARQISGSVRQRFVSHDGGESWSYLGPGDIITTAVDTSMIRYSAKRSGDDRDRLLYLGPLGDPIGSGSGRHNIAVWTSYDEGQTFINPIMLRQSYGGYSALEKLNDGSIAAFYESAASQQALRFTRVNLVHLEGVNHNAAMTHFDGFYNAIDAFRGGVGWSGSWQTNGQVAPAPGGLEFNRFQIFGDTTHMRLQAGGEMSRSLGTAAIDMNLNQTYFVSLFVRKESDAADQEWLSIRLDENGARQYAFGVHGDTFFIGLDQSSTNQFSTETVDLATSYYLLAKIEAQDDSAPTNFDQISMAWYDDPLQVPADESQVNWQLVSPSGINGDGLIDSLFIRTADQADWSLDALRIATSFDGAVFADGPSTLLGDLDGDGNLDELDVDLFVAAWLMDTSALSDELKMGAGDLNIDGIVSLGDAFLMHNAFSQQGISLPLSAFAVPEPGTFLSVVTCVLFIKFRRSKNIRV